MTPLDPRESVVGALREGAPLSARNIADLTGKHVSTVYKLLRRYERVGVAARWPGNGTAQCPDMWELVPRGDPRRLCPRCKGEGSVLRGGFIRVRRLCPDCLGSGDANVTEDLLMLAMSLSVKHE